MENLIRALSRGLHVIEYLQSHPPVSLAELHKGTDLPKVTLLRMLHTLQEEGWVYRGIGDDRYRLSYHLHHIGDNLMAVDALAEAAGPILDGLQADVLWPSDMAIRKGLVMAIVETTRKKQVVVVNRDSMGVEPEILRSAVGHAYFSFCSDTEREEILERLMLQKGEQGRLAQDKEWIEQMVGIVRKRGYGLRDAAAWPAPAGALGGLAVPVFVEERVKACINIVWPEGAVTTEQVEEIYFPRLRAAADELTAVLQEHFFLLY
ncbi:helix-turn-helix domain-containing protein [Amphritea balenae]|nr:helix-turn-helix domain-containing protein [Amphritea balenae]GGK67069.1 transcriptional regulator [Amphritea balenae]